VDVFFGRSFASPLALDKGLSHVVVDIKKFPRKQMSVDFRKMCALAILWL